jgi:hypothetical protein
MSSTQSTTDRFMTRVYDRVHIPFTLCVIDVETSGNYTISRSEHDRNAYFIFCGVECIGDAGTLKNARRLVKRLAA